MNQQQHIVSLMNSTGVCQRTNSGDLVGMYTTFQIGQILAQHSSVEAAERVAAVPLTNTHAELQTAKQEIEYLKQQVEKSNQQGILAAQERDINYHNWQTSQHEASAATALYEATLAERNKINGQWYESAAKLRTTTAQHNNLLTAARLLQQERDAAILERDELRGEHGNLLRQIDVITSQFAYTNKAWLDACVEIGRMSANYRAAHNEMTRQLKRANDTETEAERLRADVARLAAELVKLGVFVA